jgi:glycosyltransferase involved in cell wall biosynthesis
MGIVSALVCTRDRPGPLLRTVGSLLASDAAQFELIVIDQSDGPESERALAAFASDLRLRYVRSLVRGKGAALNEGLRLTRGEIVACTDDDCEASPEWVAGMARALEEQPTAAIVFCNVTAGPFDTFPPMSAIATGSCAQSVHPVKGSVWAPGWRYAARQYSHLAASTRRSAPGPGSLPAKSGTSRIGRC